MDVAAASSNIYSLDLVSFGSGLTNRGLVITDTAAESVDGSLPVDDTHTILCLGDTVTSRTAGDLTVVDRSHIFPGQVVGPSSPDLDGEQIGVVIGVATVLDLIKLDGQGEPAEIIRGVSPSALRRVRRLNLGDFVVSGPWLGRVVEVSIDVDVLFDDGAVCRVTDAESRMLLRPVAETGTEVRYRPKMNSLFYPGQCVTGDPSAVFKATGRWLNGYWNPDRDFGTVTKVEISGVLVCWVASAHGGTDQQLVETSAPPAYQNPDDLTLVCAAFDCRWGLADRCFFLTPTPSTQTDVVDDDNGGDVPAASARHHHQEEQKQASSSDDEQDHCTTDDDDDVDDDDDGELPTAPAHAVPAKQQQQEARSYRKQLRKVSFDGHRRGRRRVLGGGGSGRRPELELPMILSNTRTSVDVLWQDGTRQRGVRSASVVPLDDVVNKHEFFPGQHVIDAVHAPPPADGITGSTRRVGVVRSLDCKDRTATVSWFKAAAAAAAAHSDEAREVECDCTVSAYDLEKHPDHSAYYGDIVVRLPPSAPTDGGSTPVPPPAEGKTKKKTKNAVTAAAADLSWVGRVVDLADGHVQVNWGDGSTSMVLPHEIGVVDELSYAELYDEMGDWVEDDDIDAPQDPAAANTAGNDPRNRPAEDSNVEGDGDPGNEDGPAGILGSAVWSLIRLTGDVLARGKGYLTNWPSSSTLSTSELLPATEEIVAAAAPVLSVEDDASSGAVAETIAAAVTRNGADVDGEHHAEEGKKAAVATSCDDGSFCFPRFDVLQSPPPDHHYLDTTDQGGEKSWAKRVQKEWKILENNLPETIYVRAFEERMDLLRAVMMGASGTPYHDGLFFFDLELPPSYPAVPPQVYYHSFGLRLNPNLDASGTVCLSLLHTFGGGEGTELWMPATSSLLQVLVSIQGLVLNHQPYYNEAGYEALVGTPEGRRNALPYNENAYLLTLRAALHLLRRPPRGFEELVGDHFRRRGRFVLVACEAYLQGCAIGTLTEDARATDRSRDWPCSAGLRLALANVVPALVAAFTEIGVEGCDELCVRLPRACARMQHQSLDGTS